MFSALARKARGAGGMPAGLCMHGRTTALLTHSLCFQVVVVALCQRSASTKGRVPANCSANLTHPDSMWFTFPTTLRSASTSGRAWRCCPCSAARSWPATGLAATGGRCVDRIQYARVGVRVAMQPRSWQATEPGGDWWQVCLTAAGTTSRCVWSGCAVQVGRTARPLLPCVWPCTLGRAGPRGCWLKILMATARPCSLLHRWTWPCPSCCLASTLSPWTPTLERWTTTGEQ